LLAQRLQLTPAPRDARRPWLSSLLLLLLLWLLLLGQVLPLFLLLLRQLLLLLLLLVLVLLHAEVQPPHCSQQLCSSYFLTHLSPHLNA
jgi:hypothetical protein